MRLTLVTLFILTVSTFVTANFVNTRCKPLLLCTSLRKGLLKFQNHPNINKVYNDFVKTLVCGSIYHHYKVDCPEEIPVDEFLEFWKKNFAHYPEGIYKKEMVEAEEIIRSLNSYKPSEIKLNDLSRSEKSSVETDEDLINKLVLQCGRPLKSRTADLSGSLANPSDFPWLALLEYDTPEGIKQLCGGSLISEEIVLTAARCIPLHQENIKSVRLGEYDVNYRNNPENEKTNCNGISVPVASIIVHPDFNNGIQMKLYDEDIQNDVAIIRLAQKVKFNEYIAPICLPNGPASDDTRYYITGWGRINNPINKGLSIKTQTEVKDLEEACINSGRTNFGTVEEHICVGNQSKGSPGPCVGDSGGPLMAYERKNNGESRLTLFGISALTLSCEKDNFPYGLYTRVYRKPLLTWIDKELKKFK